MKRARRYMQSAFLASFLGLAFAGGTAVDLAVPDVADAGWDIDESYFYTSLSSQGSWVNNGDFGWVWYPYHRPAGWRPYTYGHWVWTDYGEWLRTLGEPALPRTVLLWGMRIVLIGAFAVHIIAAYQLTRMNQKARPTRYQSKRDYVAANFASRTMRWTGVIVGLFVIFHLMDLTWGTVDPGWARGHVYANVIHSFQRVPVAIVYIVANIALAIHIFHGAWSMFQSLGINNPKWNDARRKFAIGFALLIGIANVSFPLLVVTGVVS